MKVIQGIWGDVPEIIKSCLSSVKRVYPDVIVFKFKASPTCIYDSDKWRWEMMTRYDNILYIDWDITLTEPIDLPNNGRASAIYFRGQPDNCLIHSPDRKIFQTFEEDRVRRGISFKTYAWYRKVMRDKKINEITGIDHLRISGMSKLKKCYDNIK